MSFKIWYKLWISSIIDLLSFNRKRKPTDAQRKRERLRRIRERLYGTMPCEKKQKRARRRSSRSVSEGKLLKGFFMLSVTSIAILLIPFGFFDWGVAVRESNTQALRR